MISVTESYVGVKQSLGLESCCQLSSLLHSFVANLGTQKGFPAALCFPCGGILLSACVYMCGSTSFKHCMQQPGRFIGGSGLLMGFCLVYLRVLFVYLVFFFVSQRKQLGKRSWCRPAGFLCQFFFEMFVMFELICPMFRKCGLLKNVDMHEKHEK